jgi:hypothetical protein
MVAGKTLQSEVIPCRNKTKSLSVLRKEGGTVRVGGGKLDRAGVRENVSRTGKEPMDCTTFTA